MQKKASTPGLYLKIPLHPTGLASILVEEEDGANRIIVYPGANSTLTDENIEEAFTCYPDGVFVQLEIPEQAVLAAARFAQEKRFPCLLTRVRCVRREEECGGRSKHAQPGNGSGEWLLPLGCPSQPVF